MIKTISILAIFSHKLYGMNRYLFYMLIVMGVSCNNYDNRERLSGVAMEKDVMTREMAQTEMAPADRGFVPVDVPRQLIRTGFLTFETDNLKEASQFLNEQVKKFDAYIANEDEFTDHGRISRTINIRVPVDSFDELVAAITDFAGHLEQKNINQEDVTQQYVDIEARLRNKRELEKRFLELLQKATKVEELIQVEAQLANVRAEIESLEMQMQHLTKRIDYSTLVVTYYQKQTATRAFGNRLGNALQAGWQNLVSFLIWMISVWPFVIIAIALLFLFLSRRRRR